MKALFTCQFRPCKCGPVDSKYSHQEYMLVYFTLKEKNRFNFVTELKIWALVLDLPENGM